MALIDYRIAEKTKALFLIGSAVIFFSISAYFHLSYPLKSITISKQDSSLNISTTLLKIVSFGNKRLLSDLIWVQTLLESDLEHYKKNDFNNWMYFRFNQISDLDPRFYENYLFGGQYLSIVKDDPLAANFIYKRGLKYYPNDYKLNFNAGFNQYYELGNIKEGFERFEIIKDHPKFPFFMKSVLSKIKLEVTHDHQLVMKLLENQRDNTANNIIREKIDNELYAIKAERDLNCLNRAHSDCDLVDYEGKHYIKRDGFFKAVKEFRFYRVIRKKNGSRI